MTEPPDLFSATPDPVTAGEDLSVTYTNASKANETITIHMSNGSSGHDSVSVTLDANGSGTVEWTVPASGWISVILSADGSADHTVAVSPID